MNNRDDRVPVTLLTGFLGAGKTTLLNHLIRDPQAGRIAVIMNEFGDMGLDHDLIEATTEETILMQSGCLCCSIRGDLARTLSSLMGRRTHGALDFDRVVIETTGIADPGPILHTLAVDALTAPHYRMDGVVTVADAANGPGTLNTQFEAVSQIAMADLVVMTKTDLVTPHQADAFEARIAGLNGSARRIRANHGRVAPGQLFNLSAIRDGVTPDHLLDWLGPPAPDPLAGLSGFAPQGDKSSAVAPGAGYRQPPHDSRISAVSITVADPIPSSVFDFWLETMIALKGPDILRMKGIVHIEGLEWPFVFHGVQHVFDMPVPLKTWAQDDKTTRVVVIARDIDKHDLKASLETLRMRPKEATEEASSTDGMSVQTIEMPF